MELYERTESGVSGLQILLEIAQPTLGIITLPTADNGKGGTCERIMAEGNVPQLKIVMSTGAIESFSFADTAVKYVLDRYAE